MVLRGFQFRKQTKVWFSVVYKASRWGARHAKRAENNVLIIHVMYHKITELCDGAACMSWAECWEINVCWCLCCYRAALFFFLFIYLESGVLHVTSWKT